MPAVPAFSADRAALRMLNTAWLPSWHSYCSMCSALFNVSGIANVHGRAHVCGSSTVSDQSIACGPFGDGLVADGRGSADVGAAVDVCDSADGEQRRAQ